MSDGGFITGIGDAELLRIVAEDVPDMAPDVPNHLPHMPMYRLAGGERIGTLRCRRCGEPVELRIYLAQAEQAEPR